MRTWPVRGRGRAGRCSCPGIPPPCTSPAIQATWSLGGVFVHCGALLAL